MKDSIREILKKNMYKATPARLSILDIFFKNKMPLNAETIYKKIGRIKNINEATIYRTLSAFEKSGILKRVDLRRDSTYFELSADHHHHIVCTNCNTVENFENREVEKAIEKIWGRIVENSSKFKRMSEHSLELFGVCQACA